MAPKTFDAPETWDWIARSERARSMRERCIVDANGCWLYPEIVSNTGYGHTQISTDGKRRNWAAHRLMWVLEKGPIPKDMLVCHTCDVRNCINPAHLWLGTNTDNQRDRVKKGRHKGGKKIGDPRLVS